jgi:impB/mucB/samB family
MQAMPGTADRVKFLALEPVPHPARADDGEMESANPPAEAAAGARKIVHVDMDAFYASDSELRGKPVAVGGSRERGVVAAASYEARKFGVHSAMPSLTAKRRCPDLIFVKPRFDAYKAISEQIRQIFAEYTPIIEPLSLDEAYLDVSGNLSATRIAEEIRPGSAPKPNSRPRQASPTTSSSPSLPLTTASPTGSLSSLPKWDRYSSRPCRSENFTASGPRQPRK